MTTLMISAHEVGDALSHSPDYIAVELTQALVDRIELLHHLYATHGLSEVRTMYECSWGCLAYHRGEDADGAAPYDESLHLQEDELVVIGDKFWFRAAPKYEECHVESEPASVTQLLELWRKRTEADAFVTLGEEKYASWVECWAHYNASLD